MKWVLLLLPAVGNAQCVQCFRNAAAQKQAAIRAMNHGVLILLIPALTLVAGFCWMAWRRRE